jgi:hypothetical protein
VRPHALGAQLGRHVRDRVVEEADLRVRPHCRLRDRGPTM